MAQTALTFNIQKFSTEDGPGIRTTVFFKGCPLRCVWCHNPEGMRAAQDLVWYDTRCIAARDCLAACPEQALELAPAGMHIDRQRCTACGDCVKACPASALEVIGRRWTVSELLAELLKDKVFYQTSGGGVTFSGGEPMLQVDFLAELMPLCRQNGLRMALDTCGTAPWEAYQRLLPWLDLVLLDLKIMDSARHQQATGQANECLLENAARLAERGIPLWVRTPIIPGYTDDLENIRAVADFIARRLPTLQRWDLLAYTNLGKPKYHQLDRPYALENAPLFSRAAMKQVWVAAVERVPLAQWSGATRD